MIQSKNCSAHHKVNKYHYFKIALLAGIVLFPPQSDASDAPVLPSQKWAVLAGYGTSHPGWGETETRVETVDLVGRYSTTIVEDIGSSWYRGFHSLFVELPVHFLVDYGDSAMVGINFLASYTFTSSSYLPYIFAGGGPVYIAADIPGMGSDWNGNYQMGAGVSFALSTKNRLFVEARYHHISNGNTSEPNEPLNSTKLLVGVSF